MRFDLELFPLRRTDCTGFYSTYLGIPIVAYGSRVASVQNPTMNKKHCGVRDR